MRTSALFEGDTKLIKTLELWDTRSVVVLGDCWTLSLWINSLSKADLVIPSSDGRGLNKASEDSKLLGDEVEVGSKGNMEEGMRAELVPLSDRLREPVTDKLVETIAEVTLLVSTAVMLVEAATEELKITENGLEGEKLVLGVSEMLEL